MTDFSRFTAELVGLISKEMPESIGNLFVSIEYADDPYPPPSPPLFDESVDLHVTIRRFSITRPEHLKAAQTFEFACNKVPGTFTLTREQLDDHTASGEKL